MIYGAKPTVKLAALAILLSSPLTPLSTILAAQTVKIQGVIKARSGATMVIQTADSPGLVVLLRDQTKVGQIQGVLKARRKEMSMAALIPGLQVQVEGVYDGQNQLTATLVKFKGNDLERAESIQAGLHETQVETQRNREDLEKSKEELEKQNARLKAQAESLKVQQEQLTAHQEKIAANKAAIDAAIARFGQLDDYYILDEVTVYFGNGKVTIDPQYQAQLLKLAGQSKAVSAFNIQVVGYASASGSVALNQKLSEDRAGAVSNFLVQHGNIPLTNLLAPGAMGESRQVADDKTADAEAQNRRVVVRILQNKGIAGLQGAQ
jgi:outer membrane protein OmpA-like peptidoglycan-associated protein